MILFLILLLICATIYTLFYFIYYFVFRHPVKKRPDPHHIPSGPLYEDHKEKMLRVVEDMASAPHEDLEQTSYDGHRLHARLYRFSEGPQPLVLFFHGYHGIAEWDGFGMYQICKKLGYSILMPDMRAHGKSEGDISFGLRERFDVAQWISYAVQRFGADTKIILAGVSMGATSILLATGELSLPSNVAGIISDCAFSHPSGILRPFYEQKRLPAKFLFTLMCLAAKLFGHVDLKKPSAIEVIQKLQLPVLFLHGTEDFIVPVTMCHDLYEACSSEKQKAIFENANHANCALSDFERYETVVLTFLTSIL